MKKNGDGDTPVSAARSNESCLKAAAGQGQTEKHRGGQDFCEDGLDRQPISRSHVANGPSSAQVAEYPSIHIDDFWRSGWQVHSASRPSQQLANLSRTK
jgi:hypothetical protein